jgi:hypothetical protein
LVGKGHRGKYFDLGARSGKFRKDVTAMVRRSIVKVLLLVLVSAAPLTGASAGELFYWKNSYGRGAGSALAPSCGGDDYDAGLCYAKCEPGYTGVGPVCWKNIFDAKGRGAGRVPAYNCGGKEQDAGLCYEECGSGYKGAGPVCWGVPPAGYVDCGAGFAINSATCAEVTAGQVVAVGMLLAAAIPEAVDAANKARLAEMGAEGVQELGKLGKMMQPLLARLRPIFEDLARNSDRIAEALERVKPAIMKFISDDPAQAEQILQAGNYLRKYARGAAGATMGAVRGPDDALDWLRIVTSITGIMDPTPVSGVISSFAYPVYVPPPPPPATLAQLIVTRGGNFYAVGGESLYYYRLNAGGTWGALGQRIGAGWGNMRVVTAGDQGELFALDYQGNLYFYKHDANLQWQVSGAKIGFGFGGMKTIFAGGNFVDPSQRRVLFALGNDGTLWYYRFTTRPDGSMDMPFGVQIGWGWSDCSKVFAGAGGVVYCIRSNGDLNRYAYDLRNPAASTPKNVKAGVGWNAFARVFGGPGGQIYAVQPDGTLLAYRDQPGQVLGPVQIGTGWGFAQVTAMKN